MARRRLDSDTRWRIMQHEAWRRIGRDHAYAIAFGPYIARLALLVGAVVGLMVLWLKVDHTKLGAGALILAGVLGIGWIFVTQATGGVQARQARRARGQAAARPGLGLGWAVAGLVVILAGTGWLSLWSQWA
jgi:hypothetical protein